MSFDAHVTVFIYTSGGYCESRDTGMRNGVQNGSTKVKFAIYKNSSRKHFLLQSRLFQAVHTLTIGMQIVQMMMCVCIINFMVFRSCSPHNAMYSTSC